MKVKRLYFERRTATKAYRRWIEIDTPAWRLELYRFPSDGSNPYYWRITSATNFPDQSWSFHEIRFSNLREVRDWLFVKTL